MAALHLLSPAGFLAAGVYAGIKSKRTPDVGLLVCRTPATAAAVFTTNRVFAAPVKVGREHVAGGALRGIVVNAGNANACTGPRGEKDARRMCELAAEIIGCEACEILPSSTGIIGHMLPMAKVEEGIRLAGRDMGDSEEHALQFGAAILTTDTVRKAAAVEFRIGKRKVRLAGVCKGSGMIGPRMVLFTGAKSAGPKHRGASPAGKPSSRSSIAGPARSLRDKHATMLAYLTCDAQIAPAVLRRLLADAADASFNAVTIDDHASTNDTACLLASGAGGAKIASAAAIRSFASALNEVSQSLAYQIAADGEGATKVVTVTVRGATDEAAARIIARAIANSPLVKCAMHGNDPNWGRIVSAAGFAGPAFNPDMAILTLQKTVVFRRGQPVPFDAAKLSAALAAPQVTVDLALRQGDATATVWTCDLSKEYVTINADYHT